MISLKATISLLIILQFLFGGVICGTNKNTILSESGLTFLKTNDVVITGDSWTIILALNVTQHLYNALDLKDKISSLENELNVNNPEIKRLIRVADELVEVNKAMNDMLNRKRLVKRFFDENAKYDTNFVFNFGSNVDKEELKNTRESLFKLGKEQEEHKQLLQDHISFTKVLDKKVEENTKRIIDLTEEVEKEIHNIGEKFKHVDTNLKQLNDKLNYTAYLSSKFRLLQAEGLHSLITANRLQHALEMAGESKLSFYLLSPKELQNELISISSHLPYDSRLMRGLTVEDMYKYREIATVAVMANLEQIFIAIRLPLLSSDRGFNLYTVDALPMFNEELDAAIKVEPESNYLIVSDDQQYYGLADSRYLSRCKGKQPLICPADITLLNRQVPTCIGSSYFGEINNLGASCNKKLVLGGGDAVWLADGEKNGWIYSVMKSTRISLHCGGKHVDMPVLKGIGELTNSSHCSIFGNRFKLLRLHTGGISKRNSDGTVIVQVHDSQKLPPVFSTEEMDYFNNNAKIKQAIKEIKLNKRIKKDTSRLIELPMDMLIDNNNNKNNNNNNNNDNSIPQLEHHHIKLDSMSGIILVVTCVVSSTITSLIAVLIFMYVCARRMPRLYEPISRTPIYEHNNLEGHVNETLYPANVNAVPQIHPGIKINQLQVPNKSFTYR